MAIILKLYDKNETDFSKNGLCILKPISALVTEELNGDFSLIVTMPRGNTEISTEQIIKCPTPTTEQLFRVYSSDIDMLGNQIFYCRHIFYDLLDAFIEDKRPSGNGSKAITSILDGTKFTGFSDITNEGIAYYEMMNPVKAILGAENAFITVWGGELNRDNYTVKMLQRMGADRGVSIRYRKNLMGLRLQTDLSGIRTRIMPTGLKEDGQTLLKLPEKYVDSPLLSNYVNVKHERIHYSDIKVSEELPEQAALDSLRNTAKKEFEKGLDKPLVTATVEFIPLQKTEEYKDFLVLESVNLGDTVKIYHDAINIEMKSRVVSYEFDALSKRYTIVTLGSVQPKFGDTQRKYADSQVEETEVFVQQAIDNATKVISGNLGGYVLLEPSEKPERFLIMDTDDKQTARKVFKWDKNGLSYSKDGVNGTYSLMMTIDGRIVANFITEGTMSANYIKTGMLQGTGSIGYFDLNNGVNSATKLSGQLGISSEIGTVNWEGDFDKTGLRVSINNTPFCLISKSKNGGVSIHSDVEVIIEGISIKILNEKIDTVNVSIDTLETKLNALEKRLDELEANT